MGKIRLNPSYETSESASNSVYGQPPVVARLERAGTGVCPYDDNAISAGSREPTQIHVRETAP
jgi:hypothetical protein